MHTGRDRGLLPLTAASSLPPADPAPNSGRVPPALSRAMWSSGSLAQPVNERRQLRNHDRFRLRLGNSCEGCAAIFLAQVAFFVVDKGVIKRTRIHLRGVAKMNRRMIRRQLGIRPIDRNHHRPFVRTELRASGNPAPQSKRFNGVSTPATRTRPPGGSLRNCGKDAMMPRFSSSWATPHW